MAASEPIGATRADRVRDALSRHVGIASLVVAGTVLRVATAIAYRPALFWTDSWAYIGAAHDPTSGLILVDKPSGYAFILAALDVVSRHPVLVTSLQHLAGVVTGVLAYVLALRLGCARLIACVAAAFVLLDGYAIVLEQYVLTEAFFTLALFACAVLTIVGRERVPLLIAAGVLIAFAVMMRYQALFLVPVWVVYVVSGVRDRRRLLAAALAFVVPFGVYGGWHRSQTHRWLSEMDGWFLYGRIGQLADCDVIEVPEKWRGLCGLRDVNRSGIDTVDFYWWDERSPARQRFGDPYGYSHPALAKVDRELRAFSLLVIRERPLAFARVVFSDLGRFFVEMNPSDDAYDQLLLFPSRTRPLTGVAEERRDAYYPDLVPAVYAPAHVLRVYQSVVRTPHWLLAIVAVLTALGALIPARRRRHPMTGSRGEVLFLSGMGLALLAASAVTHFEMRYMIPAVPMFATAAAFGVQTLRRRLGSARAETLA